MIRDVMRPLLVPLLVSLLVLAGCAAEGGDADGGGAPADAGMDASIARDAGADDAGEGQDAATADAGGADAGELDAGAADGGPFDGGAADAGGLDAGATDAGEGADAGGADAGGADAGTCSAASAGDTLSFDGTDDLAEYPPEQVLTPGAPLQDWERFGLTWDADYLYVTMVSQGFEDEYEPVHVYLEAGSALGAASASTGKEYDSLTPELPFTPTHLIALRRTSDSGTGPYSGVYTPATSWGDRSLGLVEGTGYWASADLHTLAARVPWEALGCPSELRLTAHVVHAAIANEWKDLVPADATPWSPGGGAYYEIDLTADPAISGWTIVTP